jgi:hypothetical protein
MNKKLTLSIADPCHEDWDKMSDDAKGKFCGACQKQVVDFTGMTESQLVAFFRKPAGSVCGRFRVEQLDQQMNIPKKRIPWIRYFFTISLPAFLFSLKSGGQSTAAVITDTVFHPQQPKKMMLGKVSRPREEVTVTGKVIDSNGMLIPYATVMIKGSETGVAADEKGFFVIKTILEFPFTLVASSVGYEATEMEVNAAGSTVLTLKPQKSLEELIVNGKQIMLGGISSSIYIEESAVTKNELKEEKEIPVSGSQFLVYPNPVRRGNSFTVDPRSLERGDYKINIADLSGKILQIREVIVREGSAFSFNLSNVASGIYMVSFVSKKTGEVKAQKLIIK